MFSAGAVTTLGAIYAITLAIGFATDTPRGAPIGDPIFAILELLILTMMPAMFVLMAAIHAWAPTDVKILTSISLVSMGLVAGLTSSVHVVILTLGRDAAFLDLPLSRWLVSFEWPSVAYAIDILAWDFFFPLSVLFAAPAFRGSRQADAIRLLMIASGVLALAGLSGVVAGDMRLRNIGVIGYGGVFPVAAGLLVSLFRRTSSSEPSSRKGSEDMR